MRLRFSSQNITQERICFSRESLRALRLYKNHNITTITFFRFSGFGNRFFAFKEMGLRTFVREKITGRTFAKMLGTGGGNGFDTKPDFGTYSWLACWESKEAADNFFEKNSFFADYKQHSSACLTIYLQPTLVHGVWDGKNPFTVSGIYDPAKPTAVLTRATIKKSKIFKFWKYVPAASASIENYPEKLFSVGVGELPWVQQATVSIWKTGAAMTDFAYKNPHHAVVVKKTRELGWYSEELFARFNIVDVQGSDFFGELNVKAFRKNIL